MIHAAIGLTGRSLNLNRPCLERDIVPTLCRKPWLGPIHTGSTHATSISARIRAGNREGRRGLREDSSARLRSRQKFRRVVGRRHAQELYLLGHHFSRYNFGTVSRVKAVLWTNLYKWEPAEELYVRNYTLASFLSQLVPLPWNQSYFSIPWAPGKFVRLWGPSKSTRCKLLRYVLSLKV